VGTYFWFQLALALVCAAPVAIDPLPLLDRLATPAPFAVGALFILNGVQLA
jgi:hypothetical protein